MSRPVHSKLLGWHKAELISQKQIAPALCPPEFPRMGRVASREAPGTPQSVCPKRLQLCSGVVLPPWLLGSVQWTGVVTLALGCTQGTHSDSHPLFLTRLTCLASIK